MKNNTFIIFYLLSLLTLLSSCSKPVMIKHAFTFKISALQVGVLLNGGSFVRAISPTSNTIVQLDANNSADFPSGEWEFQAVSFGGPAPLSGKRYCGGIPKLTLSGTQQDVPMNISEANCLAEPYLTLIANIDTKFGSAVMAINTVQIINNQLVISGSKLDKVTNVNVNGLLFNENFAIESQTPTQIIANSLNAVSFDVSKIFNLIISDAQASATFNIDFTLCNSTLNGKGFDCAITPNDKDVLSYDATSGKWRPRTINGLTYVGVWNASSGTLPAAGGAAMTGDYYIISVAGTMGGVTYNVGDWAVDNGTGFDKIVNTNGVINVFGRTGSIIATKGDYNLGLMSDVNFTIPPAMNDILKFDGTNWVPGALANTDSLVEGATNLYFTNARAVAAVSTSLAGFATAANLAITNSNVSSLTTTIATKEPLITPGTMSQYLRGDKTLSNFSADVISSILTGFSSANNTVVTATDSIISAIGKLQSQLTTKADLTNYMQTITAYSVTGLTDPISPVDATNKIYVDTGLAGKLNSVNAVSTTDMTINGLTVGIGSGNFTSNTAIGVSALQLNTTGVNNTSTGYLALRTNTTGGGNTANGYLSMNANSTGNQNAAFGTQSLYLNTTGSFNSASGYFALYNNTSGSMNSGFGTQALNFNTIGSNNTAMGFNSLFSNTIGNQNTGIGYMALNGNVSGNQNIGIGYNAGMALTTGNYNVIIGSNPGSTINGLSNTILLSDGMGTERMRIDSAGNVGIGTTTPTFTFDVNGTIAATGSLQTHSDLRLKKNIVVIDNALEKLLTLKGVFYDWREDEFPEMNFEGGRQIGVIAQDVEKVFPEAVSKSRDGIRSVAYSMLIAPIIEAIKELKTILSFHKAEIEQLRNENLELKNYICSTAKDKPSFCKY